MRGSIYTDLFVLEISWSVSQETVLVLLILYQLEIEFNPTALLYSLRTVQEKKGGKGGEKLIDWIATLCQPDCQEFLTFRHNSHAGGYIILKR